jgi:heptose I phosphotransferase
VVQALEGDIYRHLDDRTTLRFEVDGQGYFAKIHRGIAVGEIAKNLLYLRLPVMGAEDEWRAIARLRELGVDTMTAVGFGSRGWLPRKRLSFLLTRALEPADDLETWCRRHLQATALADRRALARRLGSITRTLHDNGVNHRDYYLCHFLMDQSPGYADAAPAARPLYLIDLHRVQLRRRIPRRWRIKDLASLYYSARLVGFNDCDALAFWRCYALTERGRPRPVNARDRRLWALVCRRAAVLYRKGERKGYHQRPPETEAPP